MEVDPRSHVPIYLQIANAIRRSVAAGVYRPGEALPSLRALALQAHVNPNTVQRAYDELSREGLIYTLRGKGLFVAEQGTADARVCAQQTVRKSFEQGIRDGYAAGLNAGEIRNIFTESMNDTGKGGK